ncbi:hypothetical protein [Streptococcus pluranimalium]|uniref:hypothetical protein n=1 Tax=Streptococcus pluranimalium TaxID=82348 RepID=UPI0039FDDEF2
MTISITEAIHYQISILVNKRLASLAQNQLELLNQTKANKSSYESFLNDLI